MACMLICFCLFIFFLLDCGGFCFGEMIFLICCQIFSPSQGNEHGCFSLWRIVSSAVTCPYVYLLTTHRRGMPICNLSPSLSWSSKWQSDIPRVFVLGGTENTYRHGGIWVACVVVYVEMQHLTSSTSTFSILAAHFSCSLFPFSNQMFWLVETSHVRSQHGDNVCWWSSCCCPVHIAINNNIITLLYWPVPYLWSLFLWCVSRF